MKPTLFVILSTLGTLAYGGQIVLGTNAIVNPGAEGGPGSADGNTVELNVPGWTTSGNFTVVAYGPANGEINNAPSAGFGNNFFAGGPGNASSFAEQTIDVSNVSSLINAGEVTFTLSGYFGGYLTQDDSALLTVNFLDSGLTTISSVGIGGDNVVARNDQTTLLLSETAGQVPVGTESIQFVLQMTRITGSYNDGYADNLSFVAVDPPAGGDVPEPSTWALCGLGIAGLAVGLRRLVR
jgi:hypothetical protein